MRHAAPVRRELATRTVFNVLGPLTNPAGARAQVVGVYAPELVETIASVLATLGARRAFVVHGAGGIDELSPAGPNLVCEVVDGDVTRREIDPLDLGVPRCSSADLAGGTPEENAAVVREIFAGAPGPKREAVLLNAAGAIAAAGHAADLEDGYRLAAEAVDSGAAAERLEALVAFSQQEAVGLMGRVPGTRSPQGRASRAIAEVKRRSPSAGDLRPDADPAALARRFEENGAAAVSILVDERFGGTFDDLRGRAGGDDVPLLAKGFFDDQGDLLQARIAGADAALLLLRDLDDEQARLMLAGGRELGLDLLVEAHDADELGARRRARRGDHRRSTRATSATFDDRPPRRSSRSSPARPRDRVIVAESAIGNRAQGAEAELAGADAILVGSALMRADDPGAKLAELLARPLVKICGLTREEDVAAAAEAGADLAGLRPRREPAPRRRRRCPCPRRCSPSRSASASPPTPAPTSSSSTRRRTATAPATASLLREGEPVGDRARPPLARQDERHWERGGRRRRPRRPRRRPRRRTTSAPRSRRSAPGASTRAGASRARPGVKDHGEGARVRRGGALARRRSRA